MATGTAGRNATADDADPVVARYSVFLKPQLPAHQKLLVLQYPNKVDKASMPTPTELRIKPSSGMVEVDMPLDYSTAYDRAKGMAWGAALASSTKAKAGGSHGLAGGFGVSGQQGTRGRNMPGAGAGTGPSGAGGRSASTAAMVSDGLHGSAMDWAEAVRQDRVLRLQTLGGMCPPQRSVEARWMIGVFDGGNLHLTPVNSLVHLRPQLHHIDAEAEVDRQKHRDSTSGSGASGADGGGAGGRGAGGAGGGASAARAIHMTIKSAGADGDEMVTETMADRLRAVQMESWSRMAYVGDDDENSWDVYDQTLFLREKAAPVAAAVAAGGAAEGEGEGKGKGVAADGTAVDSQPLASKVPSLRTKWKEDNMLQAISGMPKPPVEDIPGPAPAVVSANSKGKGKEGTDDVNGVDTSAGIKEEPTVSAMPAPVMRRGRPGRTAGAGTTGAAGAVPLTSAARGRGSRTRQAAGSARGSAMEID